MQAPKGPICQSCSMPMEKKELFGSNADGSLHNEYCIYCFKMGKFTEPNLTKEQMIEKLILMAGKMNMTPEKARAMAEEIIPTLKRWKKKKCCCC